jgi:hypothetical protein
VEAFWNAVRAQEQKIDCLEQTIIDLARLMGIANRDHEEESNLLKSRDISYTNFLVVLENDDLNF